MSDIIERLIGEDRNKLIEQGRQQGIEQGMQEGRQEGRQEGQSDLLSTLIKNGMSPEDLAKFSNIPISEIKQLCTAH